MSKILSIYQFYEVVIDENDDMVASYEANDLPHADFIVKAVCDKWNEDADAFMLDLMNREFKGKIKSCKMKPYKSKDGVCAAVHIEGNPGVQFRSPFKEDVMDFMSAQYSDGWGEGVFGPANIMTAPDGTRFYLE